MSGDLPEIFRPFPPDSFAWAKSIVDRFMLNHPLLIDDPGKRDRQLRKALQDAATIARIAEKIAGHAWKKHVVQRNEFPEIKDREQFRNLIGSILSNPSKTKSLAGGRTGYLDKKTGTVVVRDPRRRDQGTVFRPLDAERYFDKHLE
jgi:hypothetical protein